MSSDNMSSREKEGPFKVDPETSAKIKQWEEFQGTDLEGTLLSSQRARYPNAPEISDREKRNLIRLTKIALLIRPKTHGGRIRFLEVLGMGGYALRSDYLKIPEEKLKDYVEKVVIPDIGLKAGLYCYDDLQRIREKRDQLDREGN